MPNFAYRRLSTPNLAYGLADAGHCAWKTALQAYAQEDTSEFALERLADFRHFLLGQQVQLLGRSRDRVNRLNFDDDGNLSPLLFGVRLYHATVSRRYTGDF